MESYANKRREKLVRQKKFYMTSAKVLEILSWVNVVLCFLLSALMFAKVIANVYGMVFCVVFLICSNVERILLSKENLKINKSFVLEERLRVVAQDELIVYFSFSFVLDKLFDEYQQQIKAEEQSCKAAGFRVLTASFSDDKISMLSTEVLPCNHEKLSDTLGVEIFEGIPLNTESETYSYKIILPKPCCVFIVDYPNVIFYINAVQEFAQAIYISKKERIFLLKVTDEIDT